MSRNAQDAISKAASPCKDRISCRQVSKYELVQELSEFGLHYAVKLGSISAGAHFPGT
jgi:hypothetical protein